MSEGKDLRKAECPYCGGSLPKVPAKKTKCPHCSKEMFVRTRPKDGARVVVTKEEADKIQEQWALVAGSPSVGPRERDAEWGRLNREGSEHARAGAWGLYRNTVFDRAEILRREMRLSYALKLYLETAYLDVNGPRNVGGMPGLKPFEPSEGCLAPGVVKLVRMLAGELGMGKDDLRKLFVEHNTEMRSSLRILPVAPEDCWLTLEQAISEPS